LKKIQPNQIKQQWGNFTLLFSGMTLPKEEQRWPGLSRNHGLADESL